MKSSQLCCLTEGKVTWPTLHLLWVSSQACRYHFLSSFLLYSEKFSRSVYTKTRILNPVPGMGWQLNKSLLHERRLLTTSFLPTKVLDLEQSSKKTIRKDHLLGEQAFSLLAQTFISHNHRNWVVFPALAPDSSLLSVQTLGVSGDISNSWAPTTPLRDLHWIPGSGLAQSQQFQASGGEQADGSFLSLSPF